VVPGAVLLHHTQQVDAIGVVLEDGLAPQRIDPLRDLSKGVVLRLIRLRGAIVQDPCGYACLAAVPFPNGSRLVRIEIPDAIFERLFLALEDAHGLTDIPLYMDPVV